jgi:glycerol-3-phosphate acyltransferase PlsY
LLNTIQFLTIPLGYLIGSIPSAFIVGKVLGRIDLRNEGDGKISPAAVYRRLGLLPFLLAVSGDVAKSLLAVFLARLVSGDDWTLSLLTGAAVVIGHDWPIFLKFRGGLGATVIYGALAATTFLQLMVAFMPALIYAIVTRKSGASTAIIGLGLAAVYLIQKLVLAPQIHFLDIPWALVPYPLILLGLMVLKKYQIKKRMDHMFELSDD